MNDLKFAFRQFLKHPGFTSVAMLTLALGIGVNIAIFTLFNALALRPLPVHEPGRLVSVYRNTLDHPGVGNHLSYPEYAEYRDLNRVFSGLAAYVQTSIPLGRIQRDQPDQADRSSAGGEESIFALLVSGNYFDVLGGRCALGRTFLPQEDQIPGAQPVVVLSHRFWQRRFGSDPGLVGKTLTLHGHAFTVIGVAAPEFGGTLPVVPDAWVPMMMQAQVMPKEDLLHSRGSHFMDAIETLSIPLLRGRAFTEVETEAGSRLAVINETLANRLWPGEDPIGRRFRSSPSSPWTEVVGLVPNTRNARLWEANQPYLYLPAAPLGQAHPAGMEILVRTERDPTPVIAEMRAAIQTLDPNLRPSIGVLEGNLEHWIAPARAGALLSTVLGLLALLLTSIGIYGVMACAVNQRTREIGVRMALGARRSDVLGLVLRQGFRLVRVGVALGLIGALALARVLSRFLFGLSPLDPLAFGGVTVFLIAVAMLASFLPARRATRVDPMEALRYE
jgi:hypothetical protein